VIARFAISISQSPVALASPPTFGDTIVKVLVIVGGALLGGLLIGMVSGILVKGVTRKPTPRGIKNFIRLLGAIAVGLAIYMFVFGPGGGGLGGVGWGLGGGDGGPTGHGRATQPGPDATTRENLTPTTTPRAQVLAIDMLGGARVKENRFYLIEGEKEPATLEELQKTLEQRLKAQPPLKAIDIVIREDSVSERDPAVNKLRQLAEQLGLGVSLKTSAGEKP
jgi:hypothetical protein